MKSAKNLNMLTRRRYLFFYTTALEERRRVVSTEKTKQRQNSLSYQKYCLTANNTKSADDTRHPRV